MFAQKGEEMGDHEFWFIVGSQDLYGEEVLRIVDQRAKEMAEELSRVLPYPLKYKVTAESNRQIKEIIKEANYRDECCGVITWCHTFSPGKMWINGLSDLKKPYCHFATQYNKEAHYYVLAPDYNVLNLSSYDPDNLYRIIPYSAVFAFFISNASAYISDRFFPDFLRGLERHTMTASELNFKTMKTRFLRRISQAQ